MTVYIRELTVDDAGALFALVEANREFLTPWIEWVPLVTDVGMSEVFLRESLSKNLDIIIGAWEGLEMVGAASVIYDEGGIDLFGALVAEPHIGKGVATRMFDVCYGMQIGKRDMHLAYPFYCRVDPRNVRSERFVQKLGFCLTGSRLGEMVEYARKVG